jgi:serine protease inhibitor
MDRLRWKELFLEDLMMQRMCLAAMLSLILATTSVSAENQSTSQVANFSIKLFQQIAHEKAQENFVLSAESLKAVLLMLQEGAQGATQRELSLALCGSTQSCPIPSSKPVGYALANAVWVQKGLVMKADYLADIKKQFRSEVLSADFQADATRAAGQVNAWAKKNTQGMIKEILQPTDIEKNTAMILANALYFQGFWPTAFDSHQTTDLEFTLLNGKKTTVPTMSKNDHFFVANQKGIQLLGLPYRDSGLEMLILMPEDGVKYPEFVRAMTNDKIQSLVAVQQNSQMTLFMPKFSLASSYTDLKSTLEALGIRTIFTGHADLTKMNGQVPLSLAKVLQKAVIVVDEKGTKAAAVTAGIVMMRSVMPKMYRVDRPFVFAIFDQESHNILFMGQVVNPAQ